jgi:hypothetical protein
MHTFHHSKKKRFIKNEKDPLLQASSNSLVWGRGMSKYKGKFPTMLYVNGKAPRWGGIPKIKGLE